MKAKPIQMAILLHFKKMKDAVEFEKKADWCKLDLCNHCYVSDVKVDTYPRKCLVVYTFKFKDDQITEKCFFYEDKTKLMPTVVMHTDYLVDMVSMFARCYDSILDYIELSYLYLAGRNVWGRLIWKPDGIFLSGADIAAYQNTTHELATDEKPMTAFELFKQLSTVCLNKIPEFYKLGSKDPLGRQWLHWSGKWS